MFPWLAFWSRCSIEEPENTKAMTCWKKVIDENLFAGVKSERVFLEALLRDLLIGGTEPVLVTTTVVGCDLPDSLQSWNIIKAVGMGVMFWIFLCWTTSIMIKILQYDAVSDVVESRVH